MQPKRRSRQYRASAHRLCAQTVQPILHIVWRAVSQRGFVPIFCDMFRASYGVPQVGSFDECQLEPIILRLFSSLLCRKVSHVSQPRPGDYDDERFCIPKTFAVPDPHAAAALVGSKETIDAPNQNRGGLHSAQHHARIHLRQSGMTHAAPFGMCRYPLYCHRAPSSALL